MARTTHSHNVPERFLRQLWKHQNFATDLLRTLDDRRVEILQPGIPNFDGGPDFTNARMRIGGVLYRGDVELHYDNADWINHAHHTDPKYNSVILHVVFRALPPDQTAKTASDRSLPVLVLEHYLTSSFRELWEKMILDERSERLATIKCFDHNDDVDSILLQKWLSKLAIERVELKMRRFDERLKELLDLRKLFLNEPPRYGEVPFGINPEDLPPPTRQYSMKDFSGAYLWEQLIYEGFMEALGYSKNQIPFLKLARNIQLRWFDEIVGTSQSENQGVDIEAVLFGVSGFLSAPKRTDDAETKDYVSKLQQHWKALQPLYRSECCDESEWQFFRLRPDNFPTVRLAGASRLVSSMLSQRMLKSLIRILKNEELRNKEKYQAIVRLFLVETHGFWKTHYRFGEPAKKNLTMLVGATRADEIVQNVVVPICFLYARIFKDKEVRRATVEIFNYCLPATENSILKTMDEQLVKGKVKLNSARLQQGALQLYKFYCVEERCGECAIGKRAFGE